MFRIPLSSFSFGVGRIFPFGAYLAALVGFAFGVGLAGYVPPTWAGEVPGKAVTQMARLDLGSISRMRPFGHFRISVKQGEAWREVGMIASDAFLRTQRVQLGAASAPREGKVTLRIETLGGANAHLDSVLLNGKPPLATGWVPAGKLARADNDLVRVFGKIVELTFANPAGGETLGLELTGRMQSANMRKTPLSFPVANLRREVTPDSKFYPYRMDANRGRIVVDGNLEADRLGPPFFKETLSVSAGYPMTPTYGWVRNDNTHLYVAVDFTADVSVDDGDDYATVYVKTGEKVRPFRVSAKNTRYGRKTHAYTNRVSWEHATYEFAIPLAELGIAGAGRPDPGIGLAFDAYGTVAALTLFPKAAYNPNGNEYLVVYEDSSTAANHGQRLGPTGEAIGPQFDIAAADGATPAVAYDSVNQHYLVVWDDNIDNGIKGRFVSAAGTVIAAPTAFKISGSQGLVATPVIAFDDVNQVFLVAWQHSGTSIGYQLVDSKPASLGTLKLGNPGDETSLAQLTFSKPAVAFGPSATKAQFLIVWQAGAQKIDGVLVPSDGTGTTVLPATLNGECATVPGVAYDPGTRNFLVAYRQCGEAISARRVSAADGTLVGVSDTEVAADAAGAGPADIFVAFDTARQQYLVTWYDQRQGQDIFANVVAADGTATAANLFLLYGSRNPFVSTASISHALAYNSRCANFLESVEVREATGPVAVDNVIYLPCRGIRVSQDAGATTEGGGAAAFQVRLRTRPASNVVLNLASQDTTEGAVSPASLTFTTADWNQPHSFTVTGVNDDTPDGNQTFAVSITVDGSSDNLYKGVAAPSLTITNVDDETAGVTVSAPSSPTTELGTTASFTVVLNAQPTTNVSIGLSSNDTTEGTVAPSALTFTNANWATAQTVVVTGVNDAEQDGHQDYAIVTAAATSSDSAYNGINPADVAMTNIDDDGFPLILPLLTFPPEAPAGVSPATGVAGDTFTFSVDYTSGLGKAPAIAELWIDLDGDGAYNTLASTVGAAHPGFRNGPGGGSGSPAENWSLALLALLGGAGLWLLLLGGQRKPRWGVGAALAVVVMAGALGCAGSSSSGGDPEPTPAPTGVQEVFQLTAAATADGNFANGEPFAVSLPIDTAGSHTYRFVFYDDTNPALGLPTVERTLTVQ